MGTCHLLAWRSPISGENYENTNILQLSPLSLSQPLQIYFTFISTFQQTLFLIYAAYFNLSMAKSNALLYFGSGGSTKNESSKPINSL